MSSDSSRTLPAGASQTLASADPSETAATLPISETRAVDPSPQSLTGDRYAVGTLLGSGGMGDVLLCRDGWLGRDVAMKVMRSDDATGSEGRSRFVREARVQGQLEHPSVVPVYDIATKADGAPYFTMKRIQGMTLRSIVERLAAKDEPTLAAFGRRKLLSALAQACLAVGFAHRRGVIHRDLKPENLMLGEFGEVYVLDWGVARPEGHAAAEKKSAPSPARSDEPPPSLRQPITLPEDGLPVTVAGSLVGTPGYMSPEQARGDVDALSGRSDVYALGCILYELLTLQPLHDAADLRAMIVSTMTKVAERPSEIAPDREITPELDAICRRALALDPAERYASAREMANALERYLDGERDAELRRSLALDHLREAREALESAAAGGDRADEAKARGMRELGRALALDPSSEEAVRLVARFVTPSNADLPSAAQTALKEVEFRDRAASAKRMVLAYAVWLVFMPISLWCGVKSWPLAVALDCMICAVCFYGYWMASTGNVQPRFMRWSIGANFVVAALLSAIAGPLFVVPGVACVMAAGFLVALRPTPQTRGFIAMLTVAAILLPFALELAGVLPPSIVFEDGSIRILPRLLFFPEVPATVLLVTSAAMQILNTLWIVGGSVEALLRAERDNYAMAYRLGQLLPVQRSELAAPRP